MLLNEKLQNIGDRFFRYRSYLPLGLVLILFLERKHFYYFGSSHLYDTIFEFSCFLVALSGLLIRVLTIGYSRKGTSGRNTRAQQAESLNTDGPYSIVRNPLYLGNLLIIVGISMLSQNYELILINSLFFTCFYVPIILREEKFLLQSFGQEFLNYARHTPSILPNFKLWKKPPFKFNFIRVLYREHDGMMGITWGFYAIELLREHTINQRLSFDKIWTSIFIATLIIWCALKILKRYLKSIDRGA